jgi:hypothetical protein
MIKSNELRIGNWVLSGHFDCPQMVVGITPNEVIMIDGHHWGLELISPIPLTPEILIACGFEKDGFGDYNKSISWWPETSFKILSFAGDYLYIREGHMNHNRVDDSLCVLWNKDLHKERFTLHQLQNLYFSLTGNELTIIKI